MIERLRYVFSVAALAGAATLAWAGYGQPRPASYYLYVGALLTAVVGFGLLIRQPGTQFLWLAAVAYYAATRLAFFGVQFPGNGHTALSVEHGAIAWLVLLVPVAIGLAIFAWISRILRREVRT